MMRGSWMLFVLLVSIPSALGAQAEAGPGALQGRVIDAATGEPVPAARVELLDSEGRSITWASTDGEGAFRFTGIRHDLVMLRVERIGYGSITSTPERVVEGETVVLTLRLPAEAVLLAPFEIGVTALPRRAALEGFDDRRARGIGGTHLSREEIRSRPAGRISDLLAGVPGIRVSEGLTMGRSERLVSMAWSIPGRAGGQCPIQLFVNGVPARSRSVIGGIGGTDASDGIRVDHVAHPSELEGIEIYTDLASVPSEFLTPDAGCGVIAIWTRRASPLR